MGNSVTTTWLRVHANYLAVEHHRVHGLDAVHSRAWNAASAGEHLVNHHPPSRANTMRWGRANPHAPQGKAVTNLEILGALIIAVPGLYALYLQRRRENADVSTVYARLAREQAIENEKMQAQIDELKRVQFEDREYIGVLERYIDRLVDAVRAGRNPDEAGPRPHSKHRVQPTV